jgi:hypothetical protein
MSVSTSAIPSTSSVGASTDAYGSAFWEHLWRTAGLQFVGFFVIAAVIYGYQPHIGASPEALAAFYQGNRLRVLLATVFFGLNILNLLWFAAALRTTLSDAGEDGWGAAATAGSTAFGVMTLLQIAVTGGLAYSIASPGNYPLISALNDLSWALVVLTAFPRAMLIMSGVFGLWRAGMISNAMFAFGVGLVLLGVLGGTTWLGGAWGPDGAYSRFISPLLLLVWVLLVSRVLLSRGPATRAAW